ncbi:hypothetical protein [Niabella aurantiaca]|uniref:hypothetical protein n=1 Tax=Niabella aurantiaca TaxID=379900 RepID=UPI000374B90E|nr:hypothetical protein [Niabella aurantiaca]
MKKILVPLVYLCWVGFFICIIAHAVAVRQDLKRGKRIQNVFVVDNSAGYKGLSAAFTCRINIDGEEREIKVSPSSVEVPTGRFLVNHYVPAMYSKKHNKLWLLLLPKDFKEYSLPYPDSLRWIDSLNRTY